MNHFRLLLLLLFLALAACGKSATPSHPQAEAWRDWDKPTDPRELEAYTFAHNLKLPDSLPKSVPFDFKPYTNSYYESAKRTGALAYFDHLCKTEAGEYIFKTVDKVDGLYQMRPMPKRTEALMADRYGFEDPADWHGWEADRSPTEFISAPFRTYVFFESLQSPTKISASVWTRDWIIKQPDNPKKISYWRYSNYIQDKQPMIAEPVEQISARYGYTWRGIRRERDREFGIAGGELMVLDLQTNEVLAVRRSFAIARNYKLSGLNWEFSYICPLRKDDYGKSTAVKDDLTYFFVSKVVKPEKFEKTSQGEK